LIEERSDLLKELLLELLVMISRAAVVKNLFQADPADVTLIRKRLVGRVKASPMGGW